jgi:antitoxin component of MazEF toxin-antitoxin module
MTTVVKISDDDKIAIPRRLMELLNLSDGDQVKPVVDGGTLRLEPVESFLGLKGSLADDEAFDRAIEEIQSEWQEWK